VRSRRRRRRAQRRALAVRAGPHHDGHGLAHRDLAHDLPRRAIAARVGPFDEGLGLGAGTRWSSGEEIDYVVRALRTGARIEYDPSLVVTHPVKSPTRDELVALGRRDGASIGYILAANAFPARTRARMLVRPALGALVSLALLDATRARFHAATLDGRVRGLRGGRGRRLSSP